MDRILPERAPRPLPVVALTILLALLIAAPTALAGVSSTAHYAYKVAGVSYKAEGQVSAGRIPGHCVGIALWEGDVNTTSETESELAALAKGKGALTIHSHGTAGTIDANAEVESKLTNASYRETTACDESESETAFSLTPCTLTATSELHIHVRISGGVGTHLKLSYYFNLHNGAAGKLVPDTFTCKEPYEFPDGSCTSRATLSAFTARKVSLHFGCLFSSNTPPFGRSYTKYASVVHNSGTLILKRK